VASFVNPRLVPQMAGAEDVIAALDRKPGVVYAGLVLNERGYDRAVAAGVDEIHYAFPVSEEFAKRNQNSTVEAGINLARRLIARAREDNLLLTVTLITTFGCPFEGAIDPGKVLDVAAQVQEAGPNEMILADTIGVAVPRQVRSLVEAVRALGATVGCHFHNTRNTGIANALAAVESGAVVLDASIGGTGGCPFAPRATGNIATEDLVYLLHGMGYDTGINLDALIGCAEWLSEQLGKDLPGQVYRAGTFAPVAG
jgi:hydroxymethylglutaryl-CoA lyase/(R)-citramalyl-CoA lyase